MNWPSIGVKRQLPRNLQSSDLGLFQRELEIQIPQVESSRFEQTQVFSEGFFVRKGRWLPEPITFWDFPTTFSERIRLLKMALAQRIKAKSIVRMAHAWLLTDDHSDGYFHWVADILPKLVALSHNNPAIRQILFPRSVASGWVGESLKPFADFDFRFFERQEIAFVDTVDYLPNLAPTGNYRPEIMDALRDRFTRFFAPDAIQRNRRIWISRSKAPRRRIENEDSLLPVLRNHGVEIFHLEDLSFSDQVRLMAETKMLFGIHGAGLVNMTFLPPGSQILEIRLKDDQKNNCYFSLASAVSHGYYYLLSDPGSVEGNMVVDPKELDQVLTAMGI